jgi:hypothetical protein
MQSLVYTLILLFSTLIMMEVDSSNHIGLGVGLG